MVSKEQIKARARRELNAMFQSSIAYAGGKQIFLRPRPGDLSRVMKLRYIIATGQYPSSLDAVAKQQKLSSAARKDLFKDAKAGDISWGGPRQMYKVSTADVSQADLERQWRRRGVLDVPFKTEKKSRGSTTARSRRSGRGRN